MRVGPVDLATLRRHVREEYALLPGLRLTFAQIRRLCSVDAERCATLLGDLVAEGVVELTPDGFYCHPLAGPARPHNA